MSLRWIVYVEAKFPKGGSKTQVVQTVYVDAKSPKGGSKTQGVQNFIHNLR